MKQERFNTGWEVFDGIVDPFAVVFGSMPVGKPVTLPHDAMIAEKRDPDCKSSTQSGFYPAKTYTYTKSFFAPEAWEEGRQVLEFEGVMGRSAVYVNERFAAHHQNGYSQFFVDLTPWLKYGAENTIKVVASNAELASRWYPGSGIYRDVNLHTGGAVWVEPEGVRLATEYIEEDYAMVRAEIQLSTRIPQARQVSVRVAFLDENGAEAASGSAEVTVSASGRERASLRMTVEHPALWSPDDPRLYWCLVRVTEGETLLDEAEETFGIRTLRLDARKGLRINGKPVKLRGSCIHHDNGILGAATLEGAEEFRVRNMKEAGFNAIRSAHHPMGKAMLRVCDQLGVLVMDELTDMWNIPKNCYDASFTFDSHLEEELRSLVAKDFNHPCVVLYSTGNEIPEIGRPDGRMLNRRIVNALHALDGTRYTTAGVNGILAASDGLLQYMAGLGISSQQAQADADVSKASAGGSEALNATMAQLQQMRLDAFATSDLLTASLEEVSGTLDAAGFNYLTARHELEHQTHPDRVVVGSETYPLEIASLWEIVTRNPHVIGDFTWTGYDYLGEAGIGIFHYEQKERRQGFWPDRVAYCGDINLNGYRRPASYLREIAYGLRTDPFIAVERPERSGQTHDVNGWKYSDGLDSWTWDGFEGKPVRVRTLAKADEIALFLNGESLGRKNVGEEEKLTAFFDVTYQPGTLEAVCYTDGRETGRTALRTAGAPEKLSVQVTHPEIPVTSGVSFLIVELTDRDGIVNRHVSKKVSVEVEGAGSLAALGSADPSSEGSYLDNSCETYDGRVMAAVRGGGEPGTVTVRISAEGCRTETVQIAVQ